MMENLRKAQVIVKKLDFDYGSNTHQIKWTEVYNSLEDLLEDLKNIHIPEPHEIPLKPLYKGYEYIHSFAKQLQSGKSLTEKQLTQCKRLALEIKKAYSIKDYY